jgi:hypothetical protein
VANLKAGLAGTPGTGRGVASAGLAVAPVGLSGMAGAGVGAASAMCRGATGGVGLVATAPRWLLAIQSYGVCVAIPTMRGRRARARAPPPRKFIDAIFKILSQIYLTSQRKKCT